MAKTTTTAPTSVRGRQLLDAIGAKDDWISRVELGQATGNNHLSSSDSRLLDRMVNANLLEMRARLRNKQMGIAFEYRVKEKE